VVAVFGIKNKLTPVAFCRIGKEIALFVFVALIEIETVAVVKTEIAILDILVVVAAKDEIAIFVVDGHVAKFAVFVVGI